MTPAHLSRERRWRVLALVVLVVAGVAVAEGVRGAPAPATAAPSPSAMVGAPDAESSAWYCTGQSTAGGVSPGFLILTNTATRPVTATITAVTDSGATAHAAVAVPAQGRGHPGGPRPLVGVLGGRDRDHGGRRRGRDANRERFVGLVPGAVPEHHLGPVVLRRRFHGGVRCALHLAPQSHVDACRGRSQLHHPGGHGPPDQLPGDRAVGGPGGGGGRDVRGAGDPGHQHGRFNEDRPCRRVGGAAARGSGRDPRGTLAGRGRRSPPGALDHPPGAGGAGRLLRGRRLQSGCVHRSGDGAFPAGVRPAGSADPEGPARDDLEVGDERADADSRPRDLLHLHRRHRRIRGRGGAQRHPYRRLPRRPGPAWRWPWTL